MKEKINEKFNLLIAKNDEYLGDVRIARQFLKIVMCWGQLIKSLSVQNNKKIGIDIASMLFEIMILGKMINNIDNDVDVRLCNLEKEFEGDAVVEISYDLGIVSELILKKDMISIIGVLNHMLCKFDKIARENNVDIYSVLNDKIDELLDK